jgi:hypothetical protein
MSKKIISHKIIDGKVFWLASDGTTINNEVLGNDEVYKIVRDIYIRRAMPVNSITKLGYTSYGELREWLNRYIENGFTSSDLEPQYSVTF